MSAHNTPVAIAVQGELRRFPAIPTTGLQKGQKEMLPYDPDSVEFLRPWTYGDRVQSPHATPPKPLNSPCRSHGRVCERTSNGGSSPSSSVPPHSHPGRRCPADPGGAVMPTPVERGSLNAGTAAVDDQTRHWNGSGSEAGEVGLRAMVDGTSRDRLEGVACMS